MATKKPMKKPVTQKKAAVKKATAKNSGMDSDTKTILKILGGLSAALVLIVGSIYGYSLMEENAKDKRTAAHVTANTTSSAGTDLPSGDVASGTVQGTDNAKAFANVFEGYASTFDPDTSYEKGEVIINDPPKGFEDKLRASGFRVTEFSRMSALDMTVVRVATPPRMSIDEAIRTLAIILPGVDISPNHQYDPSAGLASATPRAVAGWEGLSPTCGRGLVIGQIDSGVDVNHPALKGQAITYKNFPKSGRRPGPPDHGTSVAAMLVGNVKWGGLLPGAKLYAANMFEVNEQGKTVGSSLGLIKGLDWLIGKKVHAINLSIAGSDNKVVRKAFEAARKQNILLIAAVGNWGRADKPAFPAAYDHVVAVTATKGTEVIYKHANTGEYVDFAAPGVGIYTALPGGGGKLQSGTSFATPYITAMAAVLVNAGKTPDANTLRRLLGPRTHDLGKPGKDDVFGFGSLTLRPVCQ